MEVAPSLRRWVPRASRVRTAFTLVELLVVIGIMGALLAVTVIAFEGVGRGAKMRAALMTLKADLSLARQYAITDRQLVFVVFPDERVDFQNNPHLGQLRYAGYFICTTARWSRQLAQWRQLPTGIIFDRTTVPPGNYPSWGYRNVFVLSDAESVTNFSVLPFPVVSSNLVEQTVPVFRFHPNGRLQHGPITPTVFLTEGSVRYDPSNGRLLDYLKQPNAPVYMVEVRPLTGRVKITELSP